MVHGRPSLMLGAGSRLTPLHHQCEGRPPARLLRRPVTPSTLAVQPVGWVERSETHHVGGSILQRRWVSLRSTHRTLAVSVRDPAPPHSVPLLAFFLTSARAKAISSV